jgi:foldase protein PrsA
MKKLLLIGLTAIILTGCKKIPKLENGQEVVARIDKKDFTAEELYQDIKKVYGTSNLVNMIDNYIANKEIKTDDIANEYAANQLANLKAQYELYGYDFESALKEAGYESEEDLLPEMVLQYKKDQVVLNYIKDTLEDEEIETYYNDNIFGPITAKHILITADVTDEMTEEEKSAKEEEALNKAKDIINQLGEVSKEELDTKFNELVQEHSDDTGSVSANGLITDFTKIGENAVDEAFWDASYELKDNEYTTVPVKSAYGYHIILKVSAEERPTLKESKSTIKDLLATEKLGADSNLSVKLWAEIREKYNLEIFDTEIKYSYDETIKSYEEN